jgi:uncharacterized protein
MPDPGSPVGRGVPDGAPGLEALIERAERVLARLEERLGAGGLDAEAALATGAWAYRLRAGQVEPVAHPDMYPLDGLLGVEHALARLRANVAAFCAGRPHLDMLLYGDRGTGKSSALRGLLRELGPKGLRLVELDSEQLLELGDLFGALRGRAEHFLLYCDDLSFDDGDPRYRRLKAVLDGGVEARPPNVMLAVTSNRRHLLTEYGADNRPTRRGDEIHPGETADEKVSLSDRFGLSLGFFGFDQDTYLRIVEHHAREIGLLERVPAAELHAHALRVALERGGRTGRTARHACIVLLQLLEGSGR